jgi:PPP family 3-phenylpropionic acid transporter
MKSYPYYRLSSYYFFYFAALGVFVPFWPIFLQTDLGFSAVQIGQLMAGFMTSKVIAPLVWGWLVDHFDRRLFLIRLAALLSIIFIAGIFLQQSFWWVMLIMLLFGFFWNASLPQFEALTLNHLGKQVDRYSQIRLWGSLGFIVMVAGLPFYLGEERQDLTSIPVFILIMFIAIWASTWLVKDKEHHVASHEHGSLWSVLKHPIVIALLLACALQQGSHGVYYTFFSIYLEEHDYSRVYIGWMWALGVMAEVILFLFMYRIMSRFGACYLFSLAMVLTTIRWVMLAYWVDIEPLLWVAQLLHAATYGLFHASAIHLIHELFPGRLQGRGQALYAGISFGVGGALGSLLSGYGWDSLGATTTFMLAAVVMFFTSVLSLVFIRRRYKDAVAHVA